MASPNTMAKLQELAKLRQQEIDKQSKAFGTLFGHGKRCSNNNPGVEVFICVRSKFSDQWSVGGFGPTAGRKPVRKAAKAACRVVVARHEGAIVEVNEEQRAPGVQFLEMGVQKGIISPKQVDLMLGVLEEQDAEKAAKQAKAKKLTEKLRRKGGPDLVLGGAGSQERNGGAGGSAEEGGVSGSGGKGEGPSGSGEGSGGSTARVPAELPVGGVLSGGVDAGSSGDCAWDSAGPEPAVPDTTHKPVQGRAAAEAAQLLSELEPVWQRVKKVVQSDTEEESEGASLGEGLQLSDSEEEEFISPRSTAADSSDSEDEVLISRAKRQQAAPSRSRRVVVLTDRAREAGLHLGGSRATSQPLAAADDGEPSGSGAGASGTGGGSGAGVSGTGSGSSDVSGGGGEAGPGGSLGQEVFKLKPDHRGWLEGWFRKHIIAGTLPKRYSKAAVQALASDECPYSEELAGLPALLEAGRFNTQDIVNIRNHSKALKDLPKGKRGAAAATAGAPTAAAADSGTAASAVTNEPGDAWLPGAAASRADVDAFVRKASAAWLGGAAAEAAEGSNSDGQEQSEAGKGGSSNNLPPLSLEAVSMVMGRHAQWVHQHPALAKRVQGFLAQARIQARQ